VPYGEKREYVTVSDGGGEGKEHAIDREENE